MPFDPTPHLPPDKCALILFERQEPSILRDDPGFGGVTHRLAESSAPSAASIVCPFPARCPDPIKGSAS